MNQFRFELKNALIFLVYETWSNDKGVKSVKYNIRS